MVHRALAFALALPLSLSLSLACDSGGGEPKTDPAAEKKAKDKAESDARIEKRRKEHEEKAAEDKRVQEEIATKIQTITAIPEGTKLPKKIADACKQVVAAQSAFMKKFYPEIDDAALTTQLGMLDKQCVEMNDIEVAMCQKFALDATDEQLKSMINEYMPACMGKYGEGAPAAQPAVPAK